MTLLVSFYTSRGIVYAADRVVTFQTLEGYVRSEDRDKVFEVKDVGINGGVVGTFGRAEIAGEKMDAWLTRTLESWEGSPRLADFGDFLRDALNDDFTGGRRYGISHGCL